MMITLLANARASYLGSLFFKSEEYQPELAIYLLSVLLLLLLLLLL